MLRWRNPEPDIQFKFGHASIAAMAVTQTSESNDQPESFFRSLREDFVVLTKARLSILVVLTSVFGYFLATKGSGTFSWGILFHLVFGTTLAAFGSAVFNQLMEVDADAKMRRTSDRPLPANRIPKPLCLHYRLASQRLWPDSPGGESRHHFGSDGGSDIVDLPIYLHAVETNLHF